MGIIDLSTSRVGKSDIHKMKAFAAIAPLVAMAAAEADPQLLLNGYTGIHAPIAYGHPLTYTVPAVKPVEIEYNPIKYETVEKEVEVPVTQYKYELVKGECVNAFGSAVPCAKAKREAEADPQLLLGGLAATVTYKAKEPIVKEIPITKYVPKVEKKTIKIPKPVIHTVAPLTTYTTAYTGYPYVHAIGKREAEADPQLLLNGYTGLGYAGLGYTGLASSYIHAPVTYTVAKPEPVEIEYQPVEYKYVEKEVEVPYVQYEYEYERKKREAEAQFLGAYPYTDGAVASPSSTRPVRPRPSRSPSPSMSPRSRPRPSKSLPPPAKTPGDSPSPADCKSISGGISNRSIDDLKI